MFDEKVLKSSDKTCMIRINTEDATGIQKYHNAEQSDDPDFSDYDTKEPVFPEGIDPYCDKTP